MAFTEDQKASIRRYMGWSGRFFNDFDTQLENAISAIETRPETEALIVANLATLDQLQVEIVGARTRLKARAVGSIQLPRGDEIAILRSEGRREVSGMAATLGTHVRWDIFSTATNRQTTTRYGGNVGRDNIIPQG